MLKYDTLEQAQFRLRQSIIMYKGHPYFVDQVSKRGQGPINLTLMALPIAGSVKAGKEGEVIIVNQDDEDLDFRIFRLGYINDD